MESSSYSKVSAPIRLGNSILLFSTTSHVYLTLSPTTSQQSRSTKNSVDSEIFTLLPADDIYGTSPDSANLKYGQSFYLRSEAYGGYLQRTCIITKHGDAPDVEPHNSYRWHIGLSDEPNQTWVLGFGGEKGQEARYGDEIGISVGGEGVDAGKPDNGIRRVLTLRECDEPQAVVKWWSTDEKLRFVQAGTVEEEKKKLGKLRSFKDD